MKKIILLLSLLLFLVSSGLAYAQEQVSDYFILREIPGTIYIKI